MNEQTLILNRETNDLWIKINHYNVQVIRNVTSVTRENSLMGDFVRINNKKCTISLIQNVDEIKERW